MRIHHVSDPDLDSEILTVCRQISLNITFSQIIFVFAKVCGKFFWLKIFVKVFEKIFAKIFVKIFQQQL
jgi:hypothetical protein